MSGRILFLGTAGDSFVVGKQYRFSGGIILNIENSQFHLDPGPGSLTAAKLMNVNLRENTAIFVSKNEIGTAHDLNAVVSAMTHDGLDKRGVIVCPSNVVQEANDPFITQRYKKYLEKTIAIDNTRKMAVNNVDIEVVETSEDIAKTCGFKFFAQRYTLGYLPDTSFDDKLIDQLRECDIIILNVSEPGSNAKEGHLCSKEAEKIIAEVKPQLAIITGFGIKMLQSEILYEAREIQKSSGVQVIAAKDGMTINPVSFAATTRPKRKII